MSQKDEYMVYNIFCNIGSIMTSRKSYNVDMRKLRVPENNKEPVLIIGTLKLVPPCGYIYYAQVVRIGCINHNIAHPKIISYVILLMLFNCSNLFFRFAKFMRCCLCIGTYCALFVKAITIFFSSAIPPCHHVLL